MNGTANTLVSMTASLVHLIRHGEVENPHHVVYADLPGYGLSARGIGQAADTSAYLADRNIGAVISSPLLRAKQTAIPIAAAHGLEPQFDPRLTEWEGGVRWAGVRWEDLDTVFPGELTAYLETPLDLPFPVEPLMDCGRRAAAAATDAAESLVHAELVVVSHQDPIHAARLVLTAATPDDYHAGKPAHASVVTLGPSESGWDLVEYWEPEQGPTFPPIE